MDRKLESFGFVHTMSSHPDLPPVVFVYWILVGAFLLSKIVKWYYIHEDTKIMDAPTKKDLQDFMDKTTKKDLQDSLESINQFVIDVISTIVSLAVTFCAMVVEYRGLVILGALMVFVACVALQWWR